MEPKPKSGSPPKPGLKPQTKKLGDNRKQKTNVTNNISRVFNCYTGRVIFESRKVDNNYGWQARFHDHIIRNDAEY